MSNINYLYTLHGETLDNIPWNVYPRPQIKRNSFFCLNGEWEFCINNDKEPQNYGQKIIVPFPPETLLSGTGKIPPENAVLWYKRTFSLPENFNKGRVLLHFGAVDQTAQVFLNGKPIGTHTGGYDAFCFDITDSLLPQNTLVVAVKDNLNKFVLPYGKQCYKRGGMWYTPVSGIWQTVWIESVPKNYIKSLKITTTLNSTDILFSGINSGSITVETPNGVINADITNGKAHIEITGARNWSPEDPYLYYFTAISGEDKIESYFALRTLEILEINGIKRLCLNGKPYFFHGLLDQGYWSDGLFTPAAPVCYQEDILAMKALGFNMLRKHIKVEPEQFYYDCDRLGMVVFQDMVNNGKYSFFRDTALPTIGLQHLPDRLLHKDKKTREAFITGMKRIVEQLYNHPSICYWTIFNEGWGQFCGNEMYDLLLKEDSTRFIDTASGWFCVKKTQVDSKHIYFRKAKLKYNGKPLVLSEFGGYSFKPASHVFNTEKTYGYAKFETRDDFVKAIQKLYTEEIIPLVQKGLCAAVYTQLSDVEDETNGILSYDRKVLKLKAEEFKHISDILTSI